MDKARPQAASLVADLLAFIAMDGCTDEQFDALALRLFAYQYESNAPFRSFCQRRGATLRNVKTWSDIPTVPIDAFKAMELRSEPASPAERVFMTSGTTGQAKGQSARGRHFHPALDVYDASMTRNFAQRFMAGQLKAIVGVELVMTRVEAKAKLSQNRTPADVEGVIAGLRSVGDAASAADVERARNS